MLRANPNPQQVAPAPRAVSNFPAGKVIETHESTDDFKEWQDQFRAGAISSSWPSGDCHVAEQAIIFVVNTAGEEQSVGVRSADAVAEAVSASIRYACAWGLPKHGEIFADNLSKAGFSLGRVSALDSQGRTIWITDAHGYEKRFVVRADKKLTSG